MPIKFIYSPVFLAMQASQLMWSGANLIKIKSKFKNKFRDPPLPPAPRRFWTDREGILKNCCRVPKLRIWLLRGWGRCLKVWAEIHFLLFFSLLGFLLRTDLVTDWLITSKVSLLISCWELTQCGGYWSKHFPHEFWICQASIVTLNFYFFEKNRRRLVRVFFETLQGPYTCQKMKY